MPGFNAGFRVRCPLIILRKFSGSPKIFRVGFKTVNISEGCAGSAGALSTAGAEPAGGAGPVDGAEPAAGAELAAGGTEPAAGAGSSETVARGVGNVSIGAAERFFEVSGGRSGRNRGKILIVFLISFSLEFSRINPPSGMVGNSGAFIIIIMSSKGFLSFFELK